jgi:hypothetical protein
MATKALDGVLAVGRALQRAGPYVLIEVVLPGGTLIALLLLLYRRGPARVSADMKRLGAATLGTLRVTVNRWRDAARLPEATRARGGRARERDGLEPLGFAFD